MSVQSTLRPSQRKFCPNFLIYRDVHVLQVSVGEPGDVNDEVDLFAVFSHCGGDSFDVYTVEESHQSLNYSG
jgi:hypothetical protein